MRPDYPYDAPAVGEAFEIAKNIFWARMSLPMQLDHINIYWLVDDDGVTIVDTCLNLPYAREMWQNMIATYIAPKPIKRVLLTHFHPDHSGLAGWFMEEFGAELWTSRTTYLLLRMLLLDVQERPLELHRRHWARVGYDQDWLEARMNKRPFNMIDTVHMLPLGFRSVFNGETLRLGGREWTVKMGNGHAPEHITLWSDDIALVGDQVLPAITPVISVFPTEPNADPLAEFTESCLRLGKDARDDQLFLCGHNRPFYGGKSRLQALATHHFEALDRLREALKTPKTMIDTYPLLFKRKINAENEGFAISEAVAHFNHLKLRGEVECFQDSDGIYRWQMRQ